jgi:hypothetical protein
MGDLVRQQLLSKQELMFIGQNMYRMLTITLSAIHKATRQGH